MNSPFFSPQRNKRGDVPLLFFLLYRRYFDDSAEERFGDREYKERIYYEIHVSSISDIIYRKLYLNYKILNV